MGGISSSDGGDGVEPSPGPSEGFGSLGRFADQRRDRYLDLARAWIRRLRVDPVRFSPEDAFNEAWLALCQRYRSGSIGPIATPEEFESRFRSTLKQVIIDRSRRQHAGKRYRGGETLSLSALEAAGFDKVDDRAPGSEAASGGEDWVRWFLVFLRRRDRSLRAIAVMKMKGYRNAEIGRMLKITVAKVERMTKEIRSILEARRDERP